MPALIPFAFLATLLGEAPARQMLDRAGLPADGTPIGHLDFWRLLRNNIDQTGDERHAIGPQTVPDGSFHLLLAAMRLGRDLGDGLARLAAASRIVWSDLPLEVRQGHDLRLRIAGMANASPQHSLYVEMVVVVIHTACCWMTGQHLQPRRLLAPPSDVPGTGSLFALLGCLVLRRGNAVELVYPASTANLGIIADRFDLWPSLMFETYRQITAEPLARASTTEQCLDLLWQAPLDQPTLAAAMGISVATLRRRLAYEGQSYRALIGQVRQQQALAALKTEVGLEDLAAGLGYSEARSLRRATHRWFGAAPSQLRASEGRTKLRR
ncbi:AraC family transcriptional regulator [Sandarakinorhabdus rubra]|uniref:AraC family transcriptional regulator n=1 Tax=Sandarakinorhabdus rubra TaxID=2672568 RepID=UPI0013D99B28|nr:AraC family transcriptional regulator [Sandarakinorhabdus rubra]